MLIDINLVTVLVLIVTFVQTINTSIMHIMSLSKFRTNQTAALLLALKGESVLLTSRLGAFKLTPVTAEEKIVSRISEGMEEVKLIEKGILPKKDVNAFIDEL